MRQTQKEMIARPPGTIPDAPGSYQFKDADGRVIYVGKAKSLRSRVGSYFQNPINLQPRTAQMVASAASVEWIQVRNDVEALMLEYSLIKQHRPRFNVRLRDDKSYPFLAVTESDEWPRAMVKRGTKDKGTRYFGPYAHAYAIRETLDSLLRTFPIRTCSDNKFNVHEKQGRPCLLYHIEKCSGPCIDAIEAQEYEHLVADLIQFLDGDTDEVVRRLDEEMRSAAGILEYERAARLRDRLASVRKVIEKQQMVTERIEDLDVFGIAEDELEAAVQVFYVRRGRVVGRKGFVVDKVEDLSRSQLIADILEQHYHEAPMGVPPLIVVPDAPEECDVLEAFLAVMRSGGADRGRNEAVDADVEWWAVTGKYRVERSVNPAAHAGSRVEIRVPQRGDKRELLEMVTRNAGEEFARHRLRRSSDHNARARALTALQEALGLPEAPLRIECYDMSHIQGSDYVGSMVVMEDGLPRPSEYRRFKVKGVGGNDDYAAMEEVLTRRLTAYLIEREKPVDERKRRFAYPPQLLLVDGGKGQLSVAIRVVEALGLEDEIPVASLAKQFEEVFVPGQADPIRINRSSEALYLLQRIRDEAHRFAITYHRKLRGRRMTASVLDDIPGLGPARRKRLLTELGGLKGVKAAPVESLLDLPWLPDKVGQGVFDRIHQPTPASAASRG
ncbi:MAG: excinuclease subunit [Acidimicrobiaceae bacterium]|nr:excinuclease subunit [Acidimicrobiaceae bacterium]MDQ1400254.1 excinuclease subunit [Acidimicrobiaceae bacterium]